MAVCFPLTGSNNDVKEADLKPSARARHPLPALNSATFPEAARRLLLLLASAAAAQRRDGGNQGEAEGLGT